MRNHPRILITAAVALVSAAGILVGNAPGNAQMATDPNAVTVTVTITGKGKDAPPAVPKDDVVVRQNGKVRPVISWDPVKTISRGTDLVILIDDELPFHVTTRWDDFQNFVTSLPANVHVGIAYANKGAVNFVQQPTLNHDAAAKAFRDPISIDIQSDAIYQSLQTLAREWPANQNRHEIVLLSSGYDYSVAVARISGVGSTGGLQPDQSIPIQSAIEDLQGKGIVVYSLYANLSSTPQNVPQAQVDWGQGGLEEVSKMTGGKTFAFGNGTPLSFKPYLDEIDQLLQQQYALVFRAQPANKGGFAALEVKVENSSVQVHAPARVFVPGGK